jgi:hypothetical protein
MWKAKAALATGSVLAALLLGELTARVYLRGAGGFGHPDQAGVDAATGIPSLLKDPIIHPYFGITTQPGNNVLTGDGNLQLSNLPRMNLADDGWKRLKANNHGFYSDFDYPRLEVTKNDYVVGVFGGSVSAYFTVAGKQALIQTLKAHPSFRDKNVVVLNFAQCGFKQPQQLLILAYFVAQGQRFDAIVNLDGFNEAALAHQNWGSGGDISMPRAYPGALIQRLSRLSDEQVAWEAEIRRLRRRKAAAHDVKTSTRSALLYAVATSVEALVESRIETKLEDRPSTPPEQGPDFATGTRQSGDAGAVADQMVDLWSNGSEAMQTLAVSRGSIYLHVLQPNQYFTRRRFDPTERRIAIREDHPYAESVEKLYPLMLARIPSLRESGLNIVSAIDIFDSEKQQVYIDNCCHYTARGNELLAAFIAEKLIETAGAKRELGVLRKDGRRVRLEAGF